MDRFVLQFRDLVLEQELLPLQLCECKGIDTRVMQRVFKFALQRFVAALKLGEMRLEIHQEASLFGHKDKSVCHERGR